MAFSSISVGFVEIKGEKEQKYYYIHADFKITSNSPLIILAPIPNSYLDLQNLQVKHPIPLSLPLPKNLSLP